MNWEVGWAVISQIVKVVHQPLHSSIRVNWEFSSNCGNHIHHHFTIISLHSTSWICRFILLVNFYFLLQARSAEVCADVLISNDLRGNDSHGVSNMLRKVIIEPNQRNSRNPSINSGFLISLKKQQKQYGLIKFVWNWNLFNNCMNRKLVVEYRELLNR